VSLVLDRCHRPFTNSSDSRFSHVLRAAREPVELDEYQANAVAARIELDLRIGAAFTRLQTLQLQAVVAALKDKIISYGDILSYVLYGSGLTLYRIVSVPHAGFRCRSVSTGEELQARNILEHQGHASARREEGELSLETSSSIRSRGCHDDAGAMPDGQTSKGHQSEPETQE